MLNVDPKFAQWVEKRRIAQRAATNIPTRNANPTPTAGAVTSNLKNNATGNSKKNTVTVQQSTPMKGTKARSVTASAPSVRKTGAKKPAVKKSVGRPAGKYRANNNF